MTRLLAIDPGNTMSAYALIDTATRRPLKVDKINNLDLVTALVDAESNAFYDRVVIEMVASYGMAVGAEVFETCVWIGRFFQAVNDHSTLEVRIDLVKRLPVKVHHCGSAKAKDANITQALVDRFAPGEPNRGKGTKAAPGWFHGFRADIWQAYALAVYAADNDPSNQTADRTAAGF